MDADYLWRAPVLPPADVPLREVALGLFDVVVDGLASGSGGAAGAAADGAAVAVRNLAAGLGAAAPRELFAEWAPRATPVEVRVPLDPAGCSADSCEAGREAKAVADDRAHS